MMNSEARGYFTLAAFILGVILSGTYGHVSDSPVIAMAYHILGGIGLPFLVWRACSAMLKDSTQSSTTNDSKKKERHDEKSDGR